MMKNEIKQGLKMSLDNRDCEVIIGLLEYAGYSVLKNPEITVSYADLFRVLNWTGSPHNDEVLEQCIKKLYNYNAQYFDNRNNMVEIRVLSKYSFPIVNEEKTIKIIITYDLIIYVIKNSVLHKYKKELSEIRSCLGNDIFVFLYIERLKLFTDSVIEIPNQAIIDANDFKRLLIFHSMRLEHISLALDEIVLRSTIIRSYYASENKYHINFQSIDYIADSPLISKVEIKIIKKILL